MTIKSSPNHSSKVGIDVYLSYNSV